MFSAFDGVNPFGDPFEFNGVYSIEENPIFGYCQFAGAISRDAAILAMGFGNIGTWYQNPLMYELGSTTTSLFSEISHLSVIARGEWILANYGWSGLFLGGTAPEAFLITIPTGLTPGGSLLLLSATYAAEIVSDWYWNNN